MHQVDRLRTAAHEDVVPIVDFLPHAVMEERGGAPAQAWSPFKEKDPLPSFGKGAGSGDPSCTTPDNNDRFHRRNARIQVRRVRASFSLVESETRELKTS